MKVQFDFSNKIIESDIIIDSFELTEIYYKELKPASNGVRFKIPFNEELSNKLKTFTERVWVRIVEKNKNIFTGILRNDFSFKKTQRNEAISVEILSPIILLDVDLKKPITKIKIKIKDLFNHLFEILEINIKSDVKVNKIIDVFQAEEKDNLQEIISKICFEAGFVFNFDSNGIFKLYPLFDIPKEKERRKEFFDGTNILDSVTMYKKEQEADNVQADWKRIEFIQDTLIFSDTQNGDDNNKCLIKIPARSFVFDTEENYIKYDSEKGDIITVTEITDAKIYAESGIKYSVSNLGKRGLFKAKNETGSEKKITRLDIYGKAYIKTADNSTRASTGKKTKKFEIKYLNSKSDVENFVKNVQSYFEYADYTLELKSKINYEVGKFVRVSEKGFGTVWARIVEKKTFLQKAYKYKLEAISDFIPSEIKTFSTLPSTSIIKKDALTPNIPTNISGIAIKDGIKIKWNTQSSNLQDSISYFIIELTNHKNKIIQYINSNEQEYFYTFDRNTDGYLERNDLSKWKIRIKSVSIYRKESEFSNYQNINIDSYGSWLLGIPTVTNHTTDRTAIIQMFQGFRSDNLTQYGDTKYKIQIRRGDIDNTNEWYAPSTSLDPYQSENNYKGKKNAFLLSGNIYSQTLPLKGQSTKKIENTLYQYKIIATNESGNEAEAVILNITALCTNLKDIVHANETHKKLYVSDLSAISANLGSITQGALSNNNNNYWALTDSIINNVFKKQGSFRVGDSNQYVQVSYQEDGSALVSIRSTNFFLQSKTAEFVGDTIVYDEKDKNKRVRITSKGFFFEKKEYGKWELRGKTILDNNGNLILSNSVATPDFGISLSDSQTVYHFDNNILDSNYQNTEQIKTDGKIINHQTPISDKCFNGTIKYEIPHGKQVIFFNNSSVIEVLGKEDGKVLLIDEKHNISKIVTNANKFNKLVNEKWGFTKEQLRRLSAENRIKNYNFLSEAFLPPNPPKFYRVGVYDLFGFLQNMPSNTPDTPYKINIYDINNIAPPLMKNFMHALVGNKGNKNDKYLDLTQTTIDADRLISVEVDCAEIFGNFEYEYGTTKYHSKYLVGSPIFKGNKLIDYSDFYAGCINLRSVTINPNAIGLSGAFSECRSLKIPPTIPPKVQNMMATFLNSGITVTPNIPKKVLSMTACFKNCTSLTDVDLSKWQLDFEKIAESNSTFENCPSISNIYCDVNVSSEELKNWNLYTLSRNNNNFFINIYDVNTGELDCSEVCAQNIDGFKLFCKTDELAFGALNSFNSHTVELLLKHNMKFGNKFSLDPTKKWLVLWADNPENVKSNCFITRKEFDDFRRMLGFA